MLINSSTKLSFTYAWIYIPSMKRSMNLWSTATEWMSSRFFIMSLNYDMPSVTALLHDCRIRARCYCIDQFIGHFCVSVPLELFYTWSLVKAYRSYWQIWICNHIAVITLCNNLKDFRLEKIGPQRIGTWYTKKAKQKRI